MRIFYSKSIFLASLLFICSVVNATESVSASKTSDSTHHIVKTNAVYSILSSNMFLNGKNRTETVCNDSLNLEFSFSPGRKKAELRVFLDSNDNGILDTVDLQYGKSIVLTDGDFNDADKIINSKYRMSVSYIPGEDIPVNHIIGKRMFFVINDGIVQRSASLIIKPTDNSVLFAGSVVNPRRKANLAIIIQSNNKANSDKYASFTDKEGFFQIYIPDYSPDGYYYISSEDRFNVLKNNYFQPLPAVVNSHNKNNYIALKYSLKTSFLSGRILNQYNEPVPNVEIFARGVDMSETKCGYSAFTDSSGIFRLGVLPGIYKLGFDAETLFPGNMYPEDSDPIQISEGELKEGISFTALKTDGAINGKVIIGGKPARNIYVAAWNDNGSVWQKTNNEGVFKLKVNKELNYHIDVNPEDIPPGYFEANPNYNSVKSDTGNVTFSIEYASVKLAGTVIEKNSHSPLGNVLLTATNGKRTVFTRTDSNGRYEISGDGGNYYLVALEENSAYNQIDTNIIANNGFYNIDFRLEKQKSVSDLSKNAVFEHMVISGRKTTIKYVIPKFSRVVLKIYDLTGKELATIEDKKKSAGSYEISLDSSKFSSGIYMYKLQAGNFSETKKFVINKPE